MCTVLHVKHEFLSIHPKSAKVFWIHNDELHVRLCKDVHLSGRLISRPPSPPSRANTACKPFSLMGFLHEAMVVSISNLYLYICRWLWPNPEVTSSAEYKTSFVHFL